MIVKRYEIEYKQRISKAKKRAFVLARTKVEAKRGLASKDGNPIIQAIYACKEMTIDDNWLLPLVEKIEFAKEV